MNEPAKELTRRQAWLKIARAYEVPVSADTGRLSGYGLCGAVIKLHTRLEISTDTRIAMMRQIASELGQELWFDPAPPNGREMRARMARKFADLKEHAEANQEESI